MKALAASRIFGIEFGGEGQNLERRDIEGLIFRNFKIANIKIKKDKLFDSFIFKFIFSIFINYLNTQNIQ